MHRTHKVVVRNDLTRDASSGLISSHARLSLAEDTFLQSGADQHFGALTVQRVRPEPTFPIELVEGRWFYHRM